VMAAIDKTAEGVSTLASVAGMKAGAGFFTVSGSGTAFTGIYVETVDSDGTVTTAYIWPSTAGALRGGTTQPTIDTQDTAGAAL